MEILADAGWQKASEEVLAKVGSGDLTGAYQGTSDSYKQSHTAGQFTQGMTDAGLTGFTGITWDQQVRTQNQIVTLTGTAALRDGGTSRVTVKLRMLPDMKSVGIDDITGAVGAKP